MDYRQTKEEPPIIYIDLEWGDDIFIFENSILNAFLMVGLIVLRPLLIGYAKDNKNQQKETV